jgi:hypothetical protein
MPSQGNGKNPHKDAIIAAMLKRGLDIPRVPIASSLDEETAFIIERQFIAAIGRHPFGPLVNLTDGGDGWSGRKLSSQHIECLRKANKGRKMSDDARKKMAQAAIGNKRKLGMTPSIETKQRMSRALLGNKNAVGNTNTRGRKLPRDEIERRTKTYHFNRIKPTAPVSNGVLSFGG